MGFRAISREDLNFSVQADQRKYFCLLPNYPFNGLRMEPILTAIFKTSPNPPDAPSGPKVEVHIVGNGVFLVTLGPIDDAGLKCDGGVPFNAPCLAWVDQVVAAINGSINGPVPPEAVHIHKELERIGVAMTRKEVPGIGFLCVGQQVIFWKTTEQRGYVLPIQVAFEFLRRYDERELSVDETAKLFKGVCMNYPPQNRPGQEGPEGADTPANSPETPTEQSAQAEEPAPKLKLITP